MVAATVGLWPPQASHKASAALTIATADLWFLALTASLMEGGRRIKNIAKKKIIVWADTVRKMLLELPYEDAGLGALHLHRKSEQLKIGLRSFRTAQVKLLSRDQKVDLNRCKHRLCPKCPEGPAWAGWPECFAYLSFCK